MWIYEKKLQYPVNVQKPDPAMAKLIITQLGGSDGEKGASDRYLNQRYAMPYPHEEMIATMVYQLLKGCSAQQIKAANAADYYVDHTAGVYPQGANGMPYTTAYIQSKGDPITDLSEDLAAEQKARTTYENLMRLAKDPEVYGPLLFLRQREIVHFQRFGEALDFVRKDLDCRNFYRYNPAFDR